MLEIVSDDRGLAIVVSAPGGGSQVLYLTGEPLNGLGMGRDDVAEDFRSDVSVRGRYADRRLCPKCGGSSVPLSVGK